MSWLQDFSLASDWKAIWTRSCASTSNRRSPKRCDPAFPKAKPAGSPVWSSAASSRSKRTAAKAAEPRNAVARIPGTGH